ncbi:cAMP-activated global transcriptional regulator CRP [Pseudovibrio axinellae]|uniref:cAMP-activated global transcriptional regulator CRP n=1 Tax=Pseudovibrio axinellae TaxID=989403 RepID=A0A165T6B4_9HYPH|nr:Crp/Fnr family transcriptional regulator [Pseudovibrio axinellae]KZL05495.1 cAMP-activated global transcriptional regulator CRP [Pseudovibrio axinellae]SEP96784.1 cAMP-binding domain of CRP or a regulatory subunit of cAMP-dependent protein kinases [Pseudovibrio axinellae]
MTKFKELLQDSFSLAGLTEEHAHGLSELAQPMSLKSRSVLFKAGDPGNGCYAIIEGSLKVSVVSLDGTEQLLAVLGSGSLVGEIALLDGSERSATVTALKPCQLAFISKAAFYRYADENPAVYRHMLQIMAKRLRRSNDALAARSFLPLNGRVAQTLLQLAETFGKNVDNNKILVHYKISQAEIANMAGGARENVSRVLNVWKREGVISRLSGYYCLEKPEVLRAAAEL